MSVLNLRTPVLHELLDLREALEDLGAVGRDILPSSTTQPPACLMKAPLRLMSLPMTRPVTLPEVSFLATASRPAQSLGMSASVSPALVHSSVLICSASVEESFGAQ